MSFAGRIDWQKGSSASGQTERFIASLGPLGQLQVDSCEGLLFVQQKKPDSFNTPNGSRFRLMFTGYLSNREDLAVSLQLVADAKSLSDRHYVRLALARWGCDAPEHLEGSFALACWMPDSRQLLLSVDHMGFGLLYYHLGDGWVAFATTPMSILKLPGVPAAPDEQRLANCLAILTDEPGHSFFAGIHRVPAACTVLLSAGKPVIRRYWQPDFDARLYYRQDSDYIEAARELLDRAVRRHSCDAGPMMFELSGGMDSSAVAATAARLLAPARINTLTALPAEGINIPPQWADIWYLSEQPHVAAIAGMHRNLHTTLLASPPSYRPAWDMDWTVSFRATGMPIANPLNLAWFSPLHEHARATGTSTILTGFLGNQSLSWDGRTGLTSMANAGQWSWVWKEASALSKNSGQSFARLLCGTLLRSGLPASLIRAIERLRRLNPALLALSPLNPEFAEEQNIIERIVQRDHENGKGSAFRRSMMLASTQDKADYIEAWRHISGCTYRHPLADRRLLEFCYAVPEDQYLRNGTTRYLARRVLADRLPAEVINSTKYGIQGADAFWRMNYQRDAIVAGIEELERSSLACRILNVPRLKAMATRWPTNPATVGSEYQDVLYRGLHHGQFLRWIENGAA